MDNMLKLKELSKRLNISKSALYNYISANEIPFIKIGGQYLFSENAINTWISDNTHNVKTKGNLK